MKASLNLIKKWMISFLRNNLGFTYRKAFVQPIRAGSPAVNILRQKFAKNFIEVLNSDFVVVNIDESLFMTNEIVSKAWVKKNATRNLNIK